MIYNPTKPTTYGIKFYIIAEAVSSYILYFKAYRGIYTSTRGTVFSLVGDLQGKGYHVYMDNYYTSINLSEELYEHGLHTCGTLRLPRGGPKALQLPAQTKIPCDQMYFGRKEKQFVVIWKDVTLVKLVTNIHNAKVEAHDRRQRHQ